VKPAAVSPCRFERLAVQLDECLEFSAVTSPIGTDGFLAHFRKRKRIVSGPFRAFGATACFGQQGFILRVKRRVGDVKVDLLFNPLAQLPHGDGFRFPVFQDGGCVAMSGKAFLQSAFLVVRLQAGDFKRMRDRMLPGVRRLLRFFDEMHQAQAGVKPISRFSRRAFRWCRFAVRASSRLRSSALHRVRARRRVAGF
jgi:hypothetical protein